MLASGWPGSWSDMTAKLYKIIILLMTTSMVAVLAQVNNPDSDQAIERGDQEQQEINSTGQDGNQTDSSKKVVQSQTQQAETENQNNPSTPDTFTPSEEISEDLSVSFPIDI